MGLGSWLKHVFKKERISEGRTDFESISVLKTETPEKIVETRIRPIKIPTIIDIGERLGLISRDVLDLKQDMVSKSWFMSEYESDGTRIMEKLDKIESRLDNLQNLLGQLNDFTKSFTKDLSKITKTETEKIIYPRVSVDVPEIILKIIQDNRRIRYKEIALRVNVTDPTLSKHLKTLVKDNKVKKTRVGKAVFYEIV